MAQAGPSPNPVTSPPVAPLRPALRFAPETLLAAQGSQGRDGTIGLKLCFFDVDGVLTDGRLWIGAEGESVKAFHALDGHGLK
ncbi:MAG: hypothetical protein ACKOER_13430, partial [Betaproteobacteria bacterium]